MSSSDGNQQTFAAPFWTQLHVVTKRVAQQYWRSPAYIYPKAVLTVGGAILIGFSFFKADNTLQGLQNQMFGVFVFLFVIIQLIFQIFPMFSMFTLPNFSMSFADIRCSYPTHPLRSQRATVENLRVAGVHVIEHTGGNGLECRKHNSP